jgi:hypothetical protein
MNSPKIVRGSTPQTRIITCGTITARGSCTTRSTPRHSPKNAYARRLEQKTSPFRPRLRQRASEMQAPPSVNLQQALDEAWGIMPFLRFGGETDWWIINKSRKTVAIKPTRAQAFAEAAAHNEALGVNGVFVCGVAGKTGQWEYTNDR